MNFTTICKSYQCHSMIFIGKMCWVINLAKKAYHRKLLHMICHQYAKFSFQSPVLHLVLEFFHYDFTCWHNYFLTQIVTFPLLHNNICYEIICFLGLFVFLLTVTLLTKAFLSLFYDSNDSLKSSEFLFVMWLWFVVRHLFNFVGNFASFVSFFYHRGGTTE